MKLLMYREILFKERFKGIITLRKNGEDILTTNTDEPGFIGIEKNLVLGEGEYECNIRNSEDYGEEIHIKDPDEVRTWLCIRGDDSPDFEGVIKINKETFLEYLKEIKYSDVILEITNNKNLYD